MNIIKEAGKIAQSFLSIDDIALGQNLVSGGFRQLGKVGISPAGPSIAVNVGARAFCLGAQLATRSAALPLKGGAKTVANLASDRAKELGERCSTLAIQGIELAGGKKAQNQVTMPVNSPLIPHSEHSKNWPWPLFQSAQTPFAPQVRN